MISKLLKLGFHFSIVKWLNTYLSRRSVRIKIGDCISSDFSRVSDVPQGSILAIICQLCQLLGLETLERRRMVAQGMFMFKLLTGRIDAPLLLRNVNFYVPTRPLRTRQFLITNFRYRLFCARDPLLLMSKNFNLFSNFIDLSFSIPKYSSVLHKSLK